MKSRSTDYGSTGKGLGQESNRGPDLPFQAWSQVQDMQKGSRNNAASCSSRNVHYWWCWSDWALSSLQYVAHLKSFLYIYQPIFEVYCKWWHDIPKFKSMHSGLQTGGLTVVLQLLMPSSFLSLTVSPSLVTVRLTSNKQIKPAHLLPKLQKNNIKISLL